MHPPKDPPGVVNIIHWTPLIKNQDVNTRYLGSYPPFWMVFKMAAVKKHKLHTKCNIALLPSVMLTCMSRISISKTLNFISDIKS